MWRRSLNLNKVKKSPHYYVGLFLIPVVRAWIFISLNHRYFYQHDQTKSYFLDLIGL